MSTLRFFVLSMTVACTLLASTAHAQGCHMPSLRDSESTSWRASVMAMFATYANSSYTGEYQGVQAKASYMNPRLWLDVSLPYYRIVRNGLTNNGVGDLAGDARVVAWSSDDETLSLGPELALTVPTGNEHYDLGMGHVMLMPGAWAKLQEGKLIIIAQVAYGRAATSLHMKGHHHEAIFPLVNPMNMQEIEHAVSVGYAVHPNVQLDVRALGAVPVNAPMGTTREVLAGGVRANAGLFDFGIEVQVPVAGAIFNAKTLLSLGAQW